MATFRKVKNERCGSLVLATFFCLVQSTYLYAAETKKYVWPDSETPLQLQLTTNKKAAILYNGMIVVPSFFGLIQNYQYDLTLSRQTIAKGPWSGLLTGSLQKLTDGYTLSAACDDASFTSETRFLSDNVIELNIRFKTNVTGSGLSTEIFKLSGSLFKDAAISVSPSVASDIDKLPSEPRELANRYLLKNKNSITIQSSICDIEITDLLNAKSLNVADFRSVSWDKYKSFYFYHDDKLIASNEWVEFQYRIEFLPPSIDFESQISIPEVENLVATSASDTTSESDSDRFFSISPRYQNLSRGQLSYATNPTIYSDFSGIAGQVAADLVTRFNLQSDVQSVPEETPDQGIIIETLSGEESETLGMPKEGFQITVTDSLVTISGVDERGCLFGAYAFADLIATTESQPAIPCGIYRDWPDLPVRAVCLELLSPAIKDVELFKSYIKAFSRARANTVIFYHKPSLLKIWENQANPTTQWSPENLAAVAAYARSLKMDVWAGLSHKFSPSDFPDLALSGTNFYDPTKAASFDFLYDQYRTLIDIYHPEGFLIGHDEIKGLSRYAELYGKSEAVLLSDSVNKIHQWFQSNGIEISMWGDMLLDYQSWQSKTGNANSGNASLESGDTAEALANIDPKVSIMDWHYKLKTDYPSIDYFSNAGFNVLGCSWHDPDAAQSMAASVENLGGNGVVATDWGFWRTLSPAATTLYSPLSGWHTDIDAAENNNDVRGLASAMRPPIKTEGLKQTTLCLSSVFNTTTWDSQAGDETGLFDLGPAVDLRALSSTAYMFYGIEYSTPGLAEERQKNCIVVTEASDQTVTISGITEPNPQFIGFLHTCYIQEPRYRSRKIGTYAFTYTDGTVVQEDIIEGWNITDIRSVEGLRTNDWSFSRAPEILIGAYPAWCGYSLAGLPLNIQMMVWSNPYPEKELQSISLKTTPIGENVKIALMAATALSP